MTTKVCVRSLILLLSALCLVSIASAQMSWWRTYGGASDECGNSAQQTTDGGYIVIGTTWSFGADSGDVYLIKTNAHGDTLWTKMYGGTGWFEGLSGQQTTDGGYVVTGYYWHNGDQYVSLVKTNASGDTLWTRTYEWSGYECGLSVQQTTDGGYIITGYSEQDSFDVYVVKTDAHGDVVWDNVYGGSSFDEGVSVQQTTDGGYIIAGETRSFGAGDIDIYLVKTDSQGDEIWTRTYGGANGDWSGSVQQTSDGGYIVVGSTGSSGAGGGDVYLVKTNATGDTLWTRTYGGAQDDGGGSVRQTTDGGYIIAGTTSSFGAGKADIYLIRTNASGDTLWTRTFGGADDEGGNSVRQTADGGYVVAGYTYSFGAGSEDVYLIKTDSLGDVGIEEPVRRHPANPTRFVVQPNPFRAFARVPGHETDVFALSDVTGRQVAVCRGDRIGAGLRPGIYFLSPIGPNAGRAVTIIKAAN